jgi:DNA-binding transcriptional LysR family regulator
MININHLRSFYYCALHKNVTKAAHSLSVSQPSVSQQIKVFEDELGFPLFFRNGRNLDLTSEGKLLFQKSRTVFDSIIGIEDFLEHRGEFTGQISLFASEEIERPFLSKITAELIKSPSFHQASFSVNSLDIESTVSEKSKTERLYLSHKKIKTMELIHEFSFPVKLISSVQNVEMGPVKTSHLKSLFSKLGQKLLIPSQGHILRTEMEKLIHLNEFKDHTLLESNVMACLTQSVREGLGCSLLPVQYVYDDIKKNRLSVYGPPNGFWEHRIYLYAPKDQHQSVANELVRIIQKFSIDKGG